MAFVTCSPILPEVQINVVVPPVVGQRRIHTTLDPEIFRKLNTQQQQVIKGFEVAGPVMGEQPPLRMEVVVDVRANGGSDKSSVDVKDGPCSLV